MGETGGLLDNEEVEFLLQCSMEDDTSSTAAEYSLGSDALLDAQEVTMRGDLDQIDLSDIFQTLAMSRMEGFLRVSNPLEHREVYFKDGFVRCLVPNRVETLRLGQRLIRAGFLQADDLRSALLEQKKSRKHLGLILVEHGHVDPGDIEDVVVNQVQEDLFSLFTWKHGTFEFFKGTVSDPVVQKRLETAPDFEVTGVLLEVARRSDEWQRIIDAVGSLDELFETTHEAPPDDLKDDQRALLEAVDGKRNIRDLGDSTLLGPFDSGCAMRDLLEAGLIRRVSIEHGLMVAEEQRQTGEVKRAVMTIRALTERNEFLAVETLISMADVLKLCGENRWAGQVLTDASAAQEDPALGLDLARRARNVSKRSLEALEHLLSLLLRTEDVEPAELIEVTSDLIDCQSDRGEMEEALALIARLEEYGADGASTRTKRARILTKLGRTDEAIEVLLELADIYKREKNRDRLVAVYEQVLKVDYRRKDIARALKALHASKLARRVKLATTFAVVLLLALLVSWQVNSFRVHRILLRVEQDASELVAAGNFDEAADVIRAAVASYGPSDVLADAQGELDGARRLVDRARNEELEKDRLLRIGRAADEIEAGDLQRALDTYFSLQETGLTREAVEQKVRVRLTNLSAELKPLAKALPTKVPQPLDDSMSPQVRADILADIERNFKDSDLKLVRGILAAKDDPRLVQALGEKDLGELRQVAEDIEGSFVKTLEIKREYVASRDNNKVARALEPVVKRAEECERTYDFEGALKAYTTLRDEHPVDDDLKKQFTDKVEKYSAILHHLETLEKASQSGNFQAAQGELRYLKRLNPEIPFDRLVLLPIRIETTPPGAVVLVDRKPRGPTPLVTHYRPAARTVFRMELEGFYPQESVPVTGDDVPRITAVLTRQHSWSFQLAAMADRAPVADGHGNVFVTDRSGTITSIDVRTGLSTWTLDTRDLSGLLSGPALLGDDRLVVASVDGTLRCLGQADGAERWSIPNLPAESRPVCTKSFVAIATNERPYALLGLDARKGLTLNTTVLPGPVQADLLLVGETVLAVTTAGTAHAIRITDGKELWRQRVGRGVVCTPFLSGSRLLVVADDGTVTMLDKQSGRTIWQRDGFPGLVLSPVVAANRVFIAEGKRIHVLDPRSGETTGRFESQDDFSSHLSTSAGSVFAADRSGRIHVIDPRTLAPRFWLGLASDDPKKPEPAIAPALRLEDGTILILFGDQTLKAYGR